MAGSPSFRYAKAGDVHIAFQVKGNGPDLVFAPGGYLGLEWFAEDPAAARFLQRLASFARLILFENRGLGRSDPIVGAPTLEERSDDIIAVLDEVGSEAATLFGFSEGGNMAAMCAASHPDRVSGLIMWGTPVRMVGEPGDKVPYWTSLEVQERALAFGERNWGVDNDETRRRVREASLLMNPDSGGSSEHVDRWMAYQFRNAPGPWLAYGRLARHIDLRPILPAISVPTLILNRKRELFVPVEHARYLAQHIPGAQLREFEGGDHSPWLGDSDPVVSTIAEFVTGAPPAPALDRVLATVLFTDLVSSTEQLVDEGDARWKEIITRHDQVALEEVRRHGGRLVKTTGDGVVATFDGPTRGVRCAQVLRERSAQLGLRMRAGLHTGEIELVGEDIGGIGVVIASRITSLAQDGEVLVSRTVRDLSAGSGISFGNRGVEKLKGVPDEWSIFGVD